MIAHLLTLFIFLCAGVIAVPIASRLGLGSVLGYLIAGIAIGPVLGWLHVDVIAIQHIAEFGVVIMLFLVGLELQPRVLWRMRGQLLGLGGLQVTLTALAATGVALLFNQPLTVAVTVGLILALSSTAIVLQTLNEKGLMRSDGGQAGFSVLLFQDIAVIPMLALIPLLALPELVEARAAAIAAHGAEDGGHGASMSLVDGLNAWQHAAVTIAAIAAVIFAGRRLAAPIFRFIAATRLRELFTAAALMMVVGVATLMSLVGLSPALGTFLAGVMLAESEYRHELESDIEPFRGLLLGVFFMTVGAGINFAVLAENPALTLGLTFALIAGKALVLLALAVIFRIRGSGRWLFALSLAQAGEFGFVLLAFSVDNAVLPDDIAAQLSLVVALSMLLTPAIFIAYDKLIAPRFSSSGSREADAIDEQTGVIIAGHGRFGGIINRLLRGLGYSTTVVDYSSAQLDMLRKFDLKVYFGDATRPDLLHAAGIEHAKLLVVAIDGKEQITELVRYVVKNHPNVHVVARAIDRNHVYDLWAVGCRDIIRETYDSSLRAGRSALEALGVSRAQAQRMVDEYETIDRQHMVEMAELHRIDVPNHENPEYVAKALEMRVQMEDQLRGSVKQMFSEGTLDEAEAPPAKPPRSG